jgi:4-amino-4-deoxy-L-arabinose transferase-like glycosyltransferase
VTASLPDRSFFAPRWLLILVLVILFISGLGIRLYDLTNLPLDFHPTRQLLSALKARGMYDQTAPGIPDWQKKMSLQQWKTKSEIEPEVIEHLVALTYTVTGEQLWVGRVYSSLFWLIGGVFLFLLVRELISIDGAVISTAYYLFYPYAVIASRSFQPDILMVMLILMFWWLITRWAKTESWGWAILAGLVGGFAIYIKFVAAFFVIGAALGTILGRIPLRELIRKKQVWVMAVLGMLPAAAYLFYGIVLNGFLGQKFSGRFIPSLLLSPLNYVQWAALANKAAGGTAIMLGLLGLLVVRNRNVRVLIFGLWAAYILYGLFFDYHVTTHDYYHLPLIPLVALSLAPFADFIFAHLAAITSGRWLRLAALGMLSYGLLAALWDVHNQIKSVDFRPQAAMWAAIGNKLNHAPNVIALTQDYGTRLAYWGWQDALIWPNSGDIDYHEVRGATFDAAQRFTKLTAGNAYFLVTDFDELDRQPELKTLLDDFTIFTQGDGYIIYDLQHPLAH